MSFIPPPFRWRDGMKPSPKPQVWCRVCWNPRFSRCPAEHENPPEQTGKTLRIFIALVGSVSDLPKVFSLSWLVRPVSLFPGKQRESEDSLHLPSSGVILVPPPLTSIFSFSAAVFFQVGVRNFERRRLRSDKCLAPCTRHPYISGPLCSR